MVRENLNFMVSLLFMIEKNVLVNINLRNHTFLDLRTYSRIFLYIQVSKYLIFIFHLHIFVVFFLKSNFFLCLLYVDLQVKLFSSAKQLSI